jgi:hypothetical protein
MNYKSITSKKYFYPVTIILLVLLLVLLVYFIKDNSNTKNENTNIKNEYTNNNNNNNNNNNTVEKFYNSDENIIPQKNVVGKSMRLAKSSTSTLGDAKEALINSNTDYSMVVISNEDPLSPLEVIPDNDYYQMSFSNKTTLYGIKIQSGVDSANLDEFPGKIIVTYSVSSLDKSAFMPVINSKEVINNSFDVFNINTKGENVIKDIYFENPIHVKHIRFYVISSANILSENGSVIPGTDNKDTVKIRTDVIKTPAYYFSIQNMDINTSVNQNLNKIISVSEKGKYLSHIDENTPFKFYSDRMGKKEIFLFKTLTGDLINFNELRIGSNKQSFDAYIERSVADRDNIRTRLENNVLIGNRNIGINKNIFRFKLSPVNSIDLDEDVHAMTIQDISSGKYANNKFEFVINEETDAAIFAIKKIDKNVIDNIYTVIQYVNEKENENLVEYNTCKTNKIYYIDLRKCYNENSMMKDHPHAVANVDNSLPKEINFNYDEINIENVNEFKNVRFFKPGVTMFVDTGFKGRGINYTIGDYSITSTTDNDVDYNKTADVSIPTNMIIQKDGNDIETPFIANNTISSFVVYPGYKVTVYDDPEQGGNGVTFMPGKYSIKTIGDTSLESNKRIFNNSGLSITNDTISSFKVEELLDNADKSIIKYKYKEHVDNNLLSGPACPNQNGDVYIYDSIQIGVDEDDSIKFNSNSDTYKPELYEGKKIGNKYNKLIKSHSPKSLKSLSPEIIKICMPKSLMNGDNLKTSFIIRTKLFNIKNSNGDVVYQDFVVTDNNIKRDTTCSNSSIVNNLYKIKEHKNPQPPVSVTISSEYSNTPVYEIVSPYEPEYKNIDCGCNCLNNKSHINNYMDTNSYVKGILNNLITRTDDVLSRRNEEITEIETEEESILNQPQMQDYLNYEKTNLLDTNKFINRDEIINYYRVKGNEGFQDTNNLNDFTGMYKIYDGQFVLLDNCNLKIDNEAITFIRLKTPIYKFIYDKKTPFYSPYSTFEGVKYRVINNDKMVHDIETNNLENLFLSIGLKVPNFIYVSKHTRALDDGSLDINYKFSNREYTTLFQMKKLK